MTGYRIETLHGNNWEPEPEGDCATIEEGEMLIADLRKNCDDYADAEMRIVEESA